MIRDCEEETLTHHFMWPRAALSGCLWALRRKKNCKYCKPAVAFYSPPSSLSPWTRIENRNKHPREQEQLPISGRDRRRRLTSALKCVGCATDISMGWEVFPPDCCRKRVENVWVEGWLAKKYLSGGWSQTSSLGATQSVAIGRENPCFELFFNSTANIVSTNLG